MLRSQDAAQPLSPLKKDWDEPPQLPGSCSDADSQEKLEHDAVFQCPVIRLTRLDSIPLDGQRDFRLGVLGVPVTLETPYMLQGQQELCYDRVAVEWGMSRSRVVLSRYWCSSGQIRTSPAAVAWYIPLFLGVLSSCCGARPAYPARALSAYIENVDSS